MPPTRLSDLRVALLAGDRARAGIAPLCEATPVDLNDADAVELAGADLLLIESEASVLAAPAQDSTALQNLIRVISNFAGPSVVWITRPTGFAPLASVLAAVETVFVSEYAAVEPVAEMLGIRPAIIPKAASLQALSSTFGFTARRRPLFRWLGRRNRRIVCPGNLPPEGRSRQGVEAILDAACDFDLEIVLPTGSHRAGIPPRFRKFIRVRDKNETWLEVVQGARIVICHSGRTTSSAEIPDLMFDSLAIGALVITPPNMLARTLFPKLLLNGRPQKAREEIEWAMRRKAEQAARSAAGRATIVNAHTYGHRLATIASATIGPVLPVARHQ